eukprot:Blabericola_migrator_1__7422@NODE_3784_length_1512_cov_74_997232_g2348_i0_p2_GENE_NODE_3784_length_1512_cov_74_997232_g2348_i0NODE_3784_length_1512_cov_74_997232_g2348_i0_p2_ORF_typecomplete_len136_score18_44BcrAbl_Oligo/PF09036_10/0_0034DUF4788/PF16032_5/0_059_NODE_3784_length_1512_cov_74_997232_g2348_i06721079
MPGVTTAKLRPKHRKAMAIKNRHRWSRWNEGLLAVPPSANEDRIQKIEQELKTSMQKVRDLELALKQNEARIDMLTMNLRLAMKCSVFPKPTYSLPIFIPRPTLLAICAEACNKPASKIDAQQHTDEEDWELIDE